MWRLYFNWNYLQYASNFFLIFWGKRHQLPGNHKRMQRVNGPDLEMVGLSSPQTSLLFLDQSTTLIISDFLSTDHEQNTKTSILMLSKPMINCFMFSCFELDEKNIILMRDVLMGLKFCLLVVEFRQLKLFLLYLWLSTNNLILFNKINHEYFPINFFFLIYQTLCKGRVCRILLQSKISTFTWIILLNRHLWAFKHKC